MFNLFKKSSETVKKYVDRETNLITYQDLENMELHHTYNIKPELPGAIECTRIQSTNEDSLVFTVSIKKDQIWERHYHDCDEACLVYKGSIIDLITGKEAGPAQILNIKAYNIHYVVANKDSIFYVEFKKPKV